MPRYAFNIVIALLVMLACTPQASADEPVFETTLAGGVRFGGNLDDLDAQNQSTGDAHHLGSGSAIGVIFNVQQRAGAYYELLYSRQHASVSTSPFDLSVEYLQFGGHLEFGEPDERIVPYFALTAGLTRFAPDSGGYQDVTEPSFGLGGGVKIRLAKHFALRADVRGFATLVHGSGRIFCLSDGGSLNCRFTFNGNTFVQGQVLLGATWQF